MKREFSTFTFAAIEGNSVIQKKFATFCTLSVSVQPEINQIAGAQ
ncbi:MAG TPA: hypothetical protein VEZ90_14655 [Blastocatellia bacterium]|nr:hypothetical protein [Blastocatellia bacterium]